MRKIVIGISGVTCGGKTTLIQFLLLKFPGCRVLYQDKYLYNIEDSHHMRVPEAGNHINLETYTAFDMNQMHQDILNNLDAGEKPGEINSNLHAFSDGNDNAPNFEKFEQMEIVNDKDTDINKDFKYKNVLILLLEGFLIFRSETIYNICDVRLFLTLDKEECYRRRIERTYAINYSKIPGYFEHAVWKEYINYFENCISNRKGIHILDGNTSILNIRNESFQIICNALDQKLALV